MCLTPITLNKDKEDAMLVGCGRCVPCHLKYCNQWVYRMSIHAVENPIYYCVTLTYDNKNLPIIKHKQTGKTYMTLVKAHITQFAKKLRYENNKVKNKLKISYFIAGEYGDKFKRPHYHAIIFGASSDTILKSWDKGSIYFGNSDFQSTTNYTLKYSLKSKMYKLYHKQAIYERPFMQCSKGIGLSLISKEYRVYPRYLPLKTGQYAGLLVNRPFKIKCITSQPPDEVQYQSIKTPLPRYYSNILNRSVDTKKYLIKSIEKHQRHYQSLEKSRVNPMQWKKMYHDYMYKLDKTQMYDNEVYINSDVETIIEKYSRRGEANSLSEREGLSSLDGELAQ
jgi:hypothetical protein